MIRKGFSNQINMESGSILLIIIGLLAVWMSFRLLTFKIRKMGHIKISKTAIASGVPQFDITSADEVLSVKIINTDDIQIIYAGGTVSTIVGTGLDQVDAQLVIDAIDVMDGASGPAPIVTLSTRAIAITGTLLT